MDAKYNKYWYFRTVADEDDDDDVNSSHMLSVSDLTGMVITSTTQITLYFRQYTGHMSMVESANRQNGRVRLTVTAGKTKQVLETLVATINASDRSNPTGITIIADDSTTDFDNTTRGAKYIHPGITGISQILVK